MFQDISATAAACKSDNSEEYTDNVIYLEAVRTFATVFPKLPPADQRALLFRHRVKASLTIIENSEGLATKIFGVKDGKVYKQSAAQIWKGEARRTEIADIEELGPLLDDLTKHEAVMCSVFPRDHVEITTQANLNGSETFARTRAHTSYPDGKPGLFPLDSDPLPGEPSRDRSAVDRIITAMMPEWGEARRLWRHSVSGALIVPEGVEPPSAGGLHAYAMVPDASLIPAIGEELFNRLWLNGYGRIITGAAGQLLVRTVIDKSVFQSERLFFEAKPIVKDGIELGEIENTVLPGTRFFNPAGIGSADKAKVAALIKAAKEKIKPQAAPKRKAFKEKIVKHAAARGLPVKEATLDKALEELEDRDIPTFVLAADFPIRLPKNGGYIAAGELRADTANHGKRFPDPFEPDSGDDRIAVAYINQPAPLLYSHIHGGVTYLLERATPSIRRRNLAARRSEPDPDQGKPQGKTGKKNAGKPKPDKVEYSDKLGFELSEPDSKGKQKRLLNEWNAARAFELEGVSFRFNEFSYENEIIGLERDGHGPSLTPIAEKTLWARVWRNYRLKFGREDFSTIIDVLAWKDKVHPAREYFDEMQAIWEAKPRTETRIETWAIDYLGVQDTKVSRFISRKSLIANVRRARQPGVKFDTMTTFEGPQDFGKSAAIATLCPRLEWYTDNFAFNHKSGREDITQSQGKLMVEIPELDGMKPAAVNRTKATLSRQFDECDMKYEKRATRRGRQFCFWGTTNEHAYLFDETGNRRIWPLKCGVTRAMADLEGLKAIRDQLWAEAAHYEALGEAIHATAADMKEELAITTDIRQVRDEWEPLIREKLVEIENRCVVDKHFVRATISEVIAGIVPFMSDFDRGKQMRVRSCMLQIGWRLTAGGKNGGPLKRDGRELWEPAKVGWNLKEDEVKANEKTPPPPPDPEVPF